MRETTKERERERARETAVPSEVWLCKQLATEREKDNSVVCSFACLSRHSFYEGNRVSQNTVFTRVDNTSIVHPRKNCAPRHAFAQDTVFVGVDNRGGQSIF